MCSFVLYVLSQWRKMHPATGISWNGLSAETVEYENLREEHHTEKYHPTVSWLIQWTMQQPVECVQMNKWQGGAGKMYVWSQWLIFKMWMQVVCFPLDENVLYLPHCMHESYQHTKNILQDKLNIFCEFVYLKRSSMFSGYGCVTNQWKKMGSGSL